MEISDRLLFGQYLLEKKKVSKTTLGRALQTQKDEKISNTPRMLGSILLNDHGVFEDRVELKRVLKEFSHYKDRMRDIYLDAKKYGADPLKKLNDEYADLVEELENAETKNIRDAIVKIEKFKIDIRKSKTIIDDNERNEVKIEELNKIINSLKSTIYDMNVEKTKYFNKYNDILKDNDRLKRYIKNYRSKYGIIDVV